MVLVAIFISGAGEITLNKYSNAGCGTLSKKDTILYPSCTPNPDFANIADPSAQYVGE